jgi:hypothetical protein
MNERLEQIVGIKDVESLDPNDLIRLSTSRFDQYIDFLRDPDRFPNSEVNKLTTLMWRLIGNHDIPITLNLDQKVPTMSFMIVGDRISQAPVFILPTDFVGKIQENPAMQLGAIVFCGSQARDFWVGKLIKRRSIRKVENTIRRAYAFEADTVLTLKKLMEESGVELELNDYQNHLINQFPNGLNDLEDWLHYPTPTYRIFKDD